MRQDGGNTAAEPGDLATALAAAAAWWREAGIDGGFDDAPRDWLAAARPPPAAEKPAPITAASVRAERAAAAPPPMIGGDPAQWPRAFDDIAGWWLAEPTLGCGSHAPRVLPRGPAAAPLMVLVPQPEDGDGERLLAGPQGRLLAAMLAALGLGEGEVYVASVVPSHLGLIDWPLLAERGMAAVLAHHIALAAPQRLLVMGREGISPLLGHDSPQAPPGTTQFHHDSLLIPVAYAPSLEGLLDRPGRKATAWDMLLRWMGA